MQKSKYIYALVLMLILYSICSFAEPQENYQGIGQVTVLSGQAIYLPFEAKIDTCLVRPGQYIKKNQPLFSLDLSVLEREIDKLEIDILDYKQQLFDLEKNNLTLSEAAVNLHQALQETEYAKKRWQDSDKLFQAGIISNEEYMWDKRRYHQAVDAYKKQLAMQKHLNNQSISSEKKLLLKKKTTRAQAKLVELKKFKKQPIFLANFEGLVTPLKLKTGEFYCVSGEKILSEQAILWLVPQQNRRIELKLDPTDLSQINIGNKADIVFLGYSNKNISSKVLEIDAIPEPNVLPPKYRIYLEMANADAIRIGTQARVKIYVD